MHQRNLPLRLLAGLLLLLCFFLPARAQQSQNLTLLSNWDNDNLFSISNLTYNDIWGWADSLGNEYAIIGSLEWTYFIDITNPANPIVRDSVEGGYNGCIHRDFKTFGKYCYGVADEGNNSTLQVMDMSYLPDSVHVTFDSDQFFVRAHNIYIEEQAARLYAVGTNTQNQGVIILDLSSTPDTPTLLASHNLSQYTHDLYVRNDTAWMNNGNQGLRVVDFSNAANPNVIGQFSGYATAGYNHSGWLTDDGSHLVMLDETHNTSCKMLDVTDLNNMSVTSQFRSKLLFPDSASIPHNPLVAGNYAAISYYHDGAQLWDVSNPANPTLAAYYDTEPNNTNYNGFAGCWGVYPYLPSGTLIASDVLNGLFVFRVGFPFPQAMSSSVQASAVTCPGGSNGTATVSAGGGSAPYSYAWSGSASTTSTASNLQAGMYTVTISDRHGYNIVDTVIVSAPAAFQTFVQTTSESCPGTADGAIDLLVLGGTPGYSYNWSTGDQVEDIVGLTTGNYTVTITDQNGCIHIDQFFVNAAAAAPVASAGTDLTSCGTNAQLSGGTAGPGQGQWIVVSGSGTLQSPASPSSSVGNLGQGSNLFAWIVTQGVCTDADTMEIYVSASAFNDAGPDQVICGNSTVLAGSSPGSGTGNWTTPTPNASIGTGNNPQSSVQFTTPGQYQLSWTVAEVGCSSTDIVNIDVQFNPDADFSYQPLGFQVNFTDLSVYSDTVSWDFGDGNTSTLSNPTHTYATGGTYNVCQTANNRCGSDQFCLEVSLGVVGLNPDHSSHIEVLPNPVTDLMRVFAAGIPDGMLVGHLVDVRGKEVAEFSTEVRSGQAEYSLSTSGLAQGIYFLQLRRGDFSEVIKVLKTN